jgi:AraC-like DNA-binding protein
MLDPEFEYVVAQEQSSFRCVHRSCDAFVDEHPWHFHPAFELTWIMQSQGTRYVGDSVERYEAGDLVLCGPNLPHCWRDEPRRPRGGGPEWIIAQFDSACFGQGFLAVPEAAALRSLLEDAHFGLAFEKSAVSRVGPLLRVLVKRSGMARLVGLIDILERLSHCERVTLAGPTYYHINQVDRILVERLECVQRYITENLSAEISQSVIARRLGMSASGFSKFFRAATGRTFGSLVKLLRINEACRLLASDSDRITNVALCCGYQHTSHFDQHFRELKGVSPSEYRRRIQRRG